MSRVAALLSSASLAGAAVLDEAQALASLSDGAVTKNPINKVVQLLTAMKEQVEKEAEEDKEAYESYGCWCTANKDQKVKAIEEAQQRIPELKAIIEESAALVAQLETEIPALEASVQEDQQAVSDAQGMREKEYAAFHKSELEQKETIDTMKQAIKVLAKVQLLQHQKGVRGAQEEVRPLLLQFKNVLSQAPHVAAFRGMMQRDMWDMMSSLNEVEGVPVEEVSGQFLRHRLAAVEQHARLSVGQDPTGLEGAAAGASSYNSRSGSIYGMLQTMQEDFEKDLFADQQTEFQALVAYHKLRSAKLGEIAAAQGAIKEKETILAEAQARGAQAKEDLSVTEDALSADQKFMLGLEENCKSNEEGYAERSKMRSEEIIAIGETIKILTTDEARDMYVSTGMTLLQISSNQGSRTQAMNAAIKHILDVARKNQNVALAALGINMRIGQGSKLDAFKRVKEVMDKMVVTLKAQQKEEVEKKDFCNKQIDKLEDEIKVQTNHKEDLEMKRTQLEGTIAELSGSLEELKTEIAQAKKSLKEAGEDRAKENKIFQESIADQRATAQILKKAMARLRQFYAAKKKSLVQVSKQEPVNKPGQAIAPPPAQSKDYSKSAGAGGVLQLLDMVLTDSVKVETELLATEQHAQAEYENMVKDMNELIATKETAVMDKTKLSQESASGLAETEGAILMNDNSLMELDQALGGVHTDCDWLLKYFDMRQQARREEMDAIAEAKAVLSGADYGKEEA